MFEPVLTFCKLGTWERYLVNFKNKQNYKRNCIWICRLRNRGQIDIKVAHITNCAFLKQTPFQTPYFLYIDYPYTYFVCCDGLKYRKCAPRFTPPPFRSVVGGSRPAMSPLRAGGLMKCDMYLNERGRGRQRVINMLPPYLRRGNIANFVDIHRSLVDRNLTGQLAWYELVDNVSSS